MSTPTALKEPLTLKSETLPNRLAKAAMTEGLAEADGLANAGHVRLYEMWAKGGAGLLITGNVQVDRDHLERPGNVILDAPPTPEARAALAAWARAARSQGAGLWMQISHAGRQTPYAVNPTPTAPSAIAMALPGKQHGAPVALTEAEIAELIARFGKAAAYAREAGFTGVQLHGAHGYLISQFLSPNANRREDAYGGSLENRARFLRACVAAVRREAGADFTLAVKMNSADFQKGGFAPEESLQVADWLAQDGVDVLEISGGTYEQPRMVNTDGLKRPDFSGLPKSTAAREAYFLDFAVAMRSRVAIPLMVTGGFRTAAAMENAVRHEGVALVGLGRPLCADPAIPAKLLSGEITETYRVEDAVRMGPGPLGPRSPITLVRAVNTVAMMMWTYQQIRRMGEGLAPDLTLKAAAALQREQKIQAAQAAARRR